MRDAGQNVERLVTRLARSMCERMICELAPLHLGPRQATVVLLVAADERRSPVTPAVVAEQVGMDRASTSTMITRLVRAQWLVSAPNPVDGRSRVLSLGPRGRRELPRIREATERVSEVAVAGLAPSEAAALRDLLARAVVNVEAGSSAARARPS